MTRIGKTSIVVILLTAWPGINVHGQDKGIIAPAAKLEKLAGGFKFTEGPATDSDGNIYFTDQPNDRIPKWRIDCKLSTFLQPSRPSHSLCLNATRNLLALADNTTQTSS